MRILTILTLAAALLGVAATPAGAQSLSERIAAVRRQNAEKKAAPTSGQMQILQALVHTEIPLDFDAVTARQFFAWFQQVLGINVIVRYASDPVGHGIDPEMPITLHAESMRALDALELALEQVGTIEESTWQVRPGFLEIGTKERLSAPTARITRTYPIDDMLMEIPQFRDSPRVGMVQPWMEAHRYGGSYRGTYGGGYYRGYGGGTYRGGYGGGYGPYGGGGFGGAIHVSGGGATGHDDEARRARAREIVELIVDSVEPTAWATNGGEWATIRHVEGSLVVTAPDFIHRQIGGYGPIPRPKPRRSPADPAVPRAGGE